MISVKQASHLQALIEAYTLAEYEVGHHTALVFCGNVAGDVLITSKLALQNSPANRLHALLLKEIAGLTDWTAV